MGSLTKTPNNKPAISIIIPVYNQVGYLISCIRSIKNSRSKATYEIIVVDDQSSFESSYEIDRIEGIRLIRNYSNLGFLRTCNRGALNSRGEYLYFLNSDTEITDDCLDELLDTFERFPKAGLVGSKLVYPDGTLQECGGIVWQDGSAWNYGRNDDPSKPEYNYTKEVDYVSGAAILVRKSDFLDIGLFDSRYTPAYYEDTDLAFKIREAGLKTFVEPRSVVIHHEGKSCGIDTSAGTKRYQLINGQKFYNKWERKLSQDHFPNAQNVEKARDRSAFKKSILVIDHYIPTFDRDAGSRCMYMYLNAMTEIGLHVTFYPDNFYQDPVYTEFLEKLGIEVLYGAHYYYNHKQWLDENIGRFDYIFLSRPHISIKHIEAVKAHCRGKIIYFGHDIHHLRLYRESKQLGNDLTEEIEEQKSQEFTLWEEADYLLYPSKEEVDYVTQHFPNKEVIEVPIYFYDDTIELPKRNFSESNGILFIGNFQHPPNLDGINWFLHEILPFIRKSIKNQKLIICGSSVPKEIELLNSDNIKVLKNVSDETLTQLYETSRLSIVPLRFGAGVKGKVLESLYHQLPLVTTSIGAQGVPDLEDCAFITDDPETFAAKCVALLVNEKTWNQFSILSRRTLFTKYSIAKAKEILKKITNTGSTGFRV